MPINFNKEPVNEKGQAHGLWERYFKNGFPDFKGFFCNGKEEGYWEYYYGHQGVIMKRGDYINGEADGHWEYYWRNGNPMFSGGYSNGKEIGIWFEYYKDGKLMKKSFYAN